MNKKLGLNTDIGYGGMCRDRNRIIAITANKKNISWYINNFVPIVMYDNYNIHCYDTNNSYELFSIYDEVIDYNFIKNSANMTESVIKELQKDNYVIVNWDRYYIENTMEYEKRHLYHEALIYGFDTDLKLLYFHDSDIGGKEFALDEISFEDFEKATEKSLQLVDKQEAKHWQYAFGHPFSSFTVKNSLDKVNLLKLYYCFYMNLKGQKIMINTEDKISNQYKCGIRVYDGIEELLFLMGENKERDYRSAIWGIKLFSCHTRSQQFRYEYLYELGILKENGTFVALIIQISKDLMILYNKINKYDYFHREKDLENCYLLVNEIRKNYENMLKGFLEIIGEALEKKIN